MEKSDKKAYINISELEKNDRAIIKYVASDRSDGKSTHIIRMCYEEFKRSGKKGVIARRKVGECSALTVEKFLVNLKKVHPECGGLTAKGSPKKGGVLLMECGAPFAVLVPLTRAGDVKGGFDVATEKNLYIDEYVPLNPCYIREEVNAIMELWRTIDRDTYTNCIWVFANHVTATNPLFSYYGVTPKNGMSEWRNGRFVLLQVANKGNRRVIAESPLGELTKGTSYGDYALGGTLDDDVSRLIHKYHQRGRYPFCFRGAHGTFGFYYSDVGVVMDYATPAMFETVYTTAQNSGTDGGIYLKSDAGKDIFNAVRNRFYMSDIYVASERVYEDARDIWKMLSTR